MIYWYTNEWYVHSKKEIKIFSHLCNDNRQNLKAKLIHFKNGNTNSWWIIYLDLTNIQYKCFKKSLTHCYKPPIEICFTRCLDGTALFLEKWSKMNHKVSLKKLLISNFSFVRLIIFVFSIQYCTHRHASAWQSLKSLRRETKRGNSSKKLSYFKAFNECNLSNFPWIVIL